MSGVAIEEGGGADKADGWEAGVGGKLRAGKRKAGNKADASHGGPRAAAAGDGGEVAAGRAHEPGRDAELHQDR